MDDGRRVQWLTTNVHLALTSKLPSFYMPVHSFPAVISSILKALPGVRGSYVLTVNNRSRSAQARMLLVESIKMRTVVDFGERPSVHMVLASFFIFACLFGSGQHNAARHKLREAVDLANALGMHLPQSYNGLEAEKREQWLRTYLVLSVTERYPNRSLPNHANHGRPLTRITEPTLYKSAIRLSFGAALP